MTQKEIYELFRNSGAIVEGDHFRYTSGRHGDTYVNKVMLLDSKTLPLLAGSIAHEFYGKQIDVVVGPTVVGAILGSHVMIQLNKIYETAMSERKVDYAFADTAESGIRIFKRGLGERISGKRVLLVDDVLNTGGTLLQMIDAVTRAGGQVAGIAILCNRGGLYKISGHSVTSLLDLRLASYDPSECPLCEKGIPINEELGG